jgi:hypothetical protein
MYKVNMHMNYTYYMYVCMYVYIIYMTYIFIGFNSYYYPYFTETNVLKG